MTTANEAYINTTKQVMESGISVTTRNSEVLRATNIMHTFEGTPLVTVRKTAWKLALREFEFFLSGGDNINYLHKSVRHWWEPWTDENGNMPNSYGPQFRAASMVDEHGDVKFFDQLEYLVNGIKNHPYSRRNVISAWNTGEMACPSTLITSCHSSIIQAFVNNNDEIDLTMYQRSGDFLLGVQHNWIQYYAFILWLARETGRKPGKLTWIGGDVHIYKDHWNVAHEILGIQSGYTDAPQLVLRDQTPGPFKADEFELTSPVPEPIIKTKIPMIV